ncbi:hypothetical protein NIES4071_53350 [Calothrix sp. NIES-4071]|nr:hypothetical protein NIES4071_53350 [Calothrix sp. NIES-4071]BAZ59643.1 hypothetical protein NIES4105_53300 [Calothrix sp. NIES-4105]
MQKKIIPYFLTLLTLTFTFFAPSATALLRQHQESPGVMRYHSQTSIKDETGHAWQIILYKVKNRGASEDINLRLVGFPGVVKFIHPQSLEVMTSQGLLLSAPDVYALSSPAPNVGEYKFTSILNKLPTTKSLKLNLPLSSSDTQIKIPTNIITEWQMLITEFD